MTYSGASDLRRRSFLKLLGLAGVAATIDPSTLLDPSPVQIEAAKAAGVPVSGDMWVANVTSSNQARRLGRLVNASFKRDILEVDRSIISAKLFGGGYQEFEGSAETTIDVTLVDVDVSAVRSAMDSRIMGVDIYLFGKKFHAEKCFMQQFAFKFQEDVSALIEVKACSEMVIDDWKA